MMKNALDKLNKFFGAVIAINIFHQIVSSAGYLTVDVPILRALYLTSIIIFAIELLLRVLVEKRLSFLLSIDGLVLVNQVFFSIYDLRILRLFRLFDIFSQSRFLLPTNTLVKTIILVMSPNLHFFRKSYDSETPMVPGNLGAEGPAP